MFIWEIIYLCIPTAFLVWTFIWTLSNNAGNLLPVLFLPSHVSQQSWCMGNLSGSFHWRFKGQRYLFFFFFFWSREGVSLQLLLKSDGQNSLSHNKNFTGVFYVQFIRIAVKMFRFVFKKAGALWQTKLRFKKLHFACSSFSLQSLKSGLLVTAILLFLFQLAPHYSKSILIAKYD